MAKRRTRKTPIRRVRWSVSKTPRTRRKVKASPKPTQKARSPRRPYGFSLKRLVNQIKRVASALGS